MEIGNSIQLIDIHLREKRKQLEQRYARVVDVVIRPIWRVKRDDRSGLIHQVRPSAIIQIWQWYFHGLMPLLRSMTA